MHFQNLHRIKSCTCIVVDQQGHDTHGKHAENSVFQRPNNDLLAGIYSWVYLHYLFLKELLNNAVLRPTVCCLVLKKSLLFSSVYSEILCLTESDHEINRFFSFHMACINKEMWNAETGLELHLSWLAGLYTHIDWPNCCCGTSKCCCVLAFRKYEDVLSLLPIKPNKMKLWNISTGALSVLGLSKNAQRTSPLWRDVNCQEQVNK